MPGVVKAAKRLFPFKREQALHAVYLFLSPASVFSRKQPPLYGQPLQPPPQPVLPRRLRHCQAAIATATHPTARIRTIQSAALIPSSPARFSPV